MSDIENGASQEANLRARYRVGVVAQYSLPAANENIVLRVVSPEGGEPQPGSQYIVEFCQAETGAVQESLDAEEGRRFDPANILRVMDGLAEDYLQSVAADWATYVAQSGRDTPGETEQAAQGEVVRDCVLVERIAPAKPDVAAIEARALADYERFLGKTVLIKAVSGFFGNDSVDINLDPPAKVLIESTRRESVLHWNDDWLDPYWEVRLVDPHPQLADIRSMWISGNCYHLDGKQTNAFDVVSVVENQVKIEQKAKLRSGSSGPGF